MSRCPFDIQHAITIVWINLSVAKETHILLSNTTFSQQVFSSLIPNLPEHETPNFYSTVVNRQIYALMRRIDEYISEYPHRKALIDRVDELDTPMSTFFSSPALIKHMCMSFSSSAPPFDEHLLISLFQETCHCSLCFPQLNQFLVESTLTRTITCIPSNYDDDSFVQFTFYSIHDSLDWMVRNEFKLSQTPWITAMFDEGRISANIHQKQNYELERAFLVICRSLMNRLSPAHVYSLELRRRGVLTILPGHTRRREDPSDDALKKSRLFANTSFIFPPDVTHTHREETDGGVEMQILLSGEEKKWFSDEEMITEVEAKKISYLSFDGLKSFPKITPPHPSLFTQRLKHRPFSPVLSLQDFVLPTPPSMSPDDISCTEHQCFAAPYLERHGQHFINETTLFLSELIESHQRTTIHENWRTLRHNYRNSLIIVERKRHLKTLGKRAEHMRNLLSLNNTPENRLSSSSPSRRRSNSEDGQGGRNRVLKRIEQSCFDNLDQNRSAQDLFRTEQWLLQDIPFAPKHHIPSPTGRALRTTSHSTILRALNLILGQNPSIYVPSLFRLQPTHNVYQMLTRHLTLDEVKSVLFLDNAMETILFHPSLEQSRVFDLIDIHNTTYPLDHRQLLARIGYNNPLCHLLVTRSMLNDLKLFLTSSLIRVSSSAANQYDLQAKAYHPPIDSIIELADSPQMYQLSFRYGISRRSFRVLPLTDVECLLHEVERLHNEQIASLTVLLQKLLSNLHAALSNTIRSNDQFLKDRTLLSRWSNDQIMRKETIGDFTPAKLHPHVDPLCFPSLNLLSVISRIGPDGQVPLKMAVIDLEGNLTNSSRVQNMIFWNDSESSDDDKSSAYPQTRSASTQKPTTRQPIIPTSSPAPLPVNPNERLPVIDIETVLAHSSHIDTTSRLLSHLPNSTEFFTPSMRRILAEMDHVFSHHDEYSGIPKGRSYNLAVRGPPEALSRKVLSQTRVVLDSSRKVQKSLEEESDLLIGLPLRDSRTGKRAHFHLNTPSPATSPPPHPNLSSSPPYPTHHSLSTLHSPLAPLSLIPSNIYEYMLTCEVIGHTDQPNFSLKQMKYLGSYPIDDDPVISSDRINEFGHSSSMTLRPTQPGWPGKISIVRLQQYFTTTNYGREDKSQSLTEQKVSIPSHRIPWGRFNEWDSVFFRSVSRIGGQHTPGLYVPCVQRPERTKTADSQRTGSGSESHRRRPPPKPTPKPQFEERNISPASNTHKRVFTPPPLPIRKPELLASSAGKMRKQSPPSDKKSSSPSPTSSRYHSQYPPKQPTLHPKHSTPLTSRPKPKLIPNPKSKLTVEASSPEQTISPPLSSPDKPKRGRPPLTEEEKLRRRDERNAISAQLQERKLDSIRGTPREYVPKVVVVSEFYQTPSPAQRQSAQPFSDQTGSGSSPRDGAKERRRVSPPARHSTILSAAMSISDAPSLRSSSATNKNPPNTSNSDISQQSSPSPPPKQAKPRDRRRERERRSRRRRRRPSNKISQSPTTSFRRRTTPEQRLSRELGMLTEFVVKDGATAPIDTLSEGLTKRELTKIKYLEKLEQEQREQAERKRLEKKQSSSQPLTPIKRSESATESPSSETRERKKKQLTRSQKIRIERDDSETMEDKERAERKAAHQPAKHVIPNATKTFETTIFHHKSLLSHTTPHPNPNNFRQTVIDSERLQNSSGGTSDLGSTDFNHEEIGMSLPPISSLTIPRDYTCTLRMPSRLTTDTTNQRTHQRLAGQDETFNRLVSDSLTSRSNPFVSVLFGHSKSTTPNLTSSQSVIRSLDTTHMSLVVEEKVNVTPQSPSRHLSISSQTNPSPKTQNSRSSLPFPPLTTRPSTSETRKTKEEKDWLQLEMESFLDTRKKVGEDLDEEKGEKRMRLEGAAAEMEEARIKEEERSMMSLVERVRRQQLGTDHTTKPAPENENDESKLSIEEKIRRRAERLINVEKEERLSRKKTTEGQSERRNKEEEKKEERATMEKSEEQDRFLKRESELLDKSMLPVVNQTRTENVANSPRQSQHTFLNGSPFSSKPTDQQPVLFHRAPFHTRSESDILDTEAKQKAEMQRVESDILRRAMAIHQNEVRKKESRLRKEEEEEERSKKEKEDRIRKEAEERLWKETEARRMRRELEKRQKEEEEKRRKDEERKKLEQLERDSLEIEDKASIVLVFYKQQLENLTRMSEEDKLVRINEENERRLAKEAELKRRKQEEEWWRQAKERNDRIEKEKEEQKEREVQRQREHRERLRRQEKQRHLSFIAEQEIQRRLLEEKEIEEVQKVNSEPIRILRSREFEANERMIEQKKEEERQKQEFDIMNLYLRVMEDQDKEIGTIINGDDKTDHKHTPLVDSEARGEQTQLQSVKSEHVEESGQDIARIEKEESGFIVNPDFNLLNKPTTEQQTLQKTTETLDQEIPKRRPPGRPRKVKPTASNQSLSTDSASTQQDTPLPTATWAVTKFVCQKDDRDPTFKPVTPITLHQDPLRRSTRQARVQKAKVKKAASSPAHQTITIPITPSLSQFPVHPLGFKPPFPLKVNPLNTNPFPPAQMNQFPFTRTHFPTQPAHNPPKITPAAPNFAPNSETFQQSLLPSPFVNQIIQPFEPTDKKNIQKKKSGKNQPPPPTPSQTTSSLQTSIAFPPQDLLSQLPRFQLDETQGMWEKGQIVARPGFFSLQARSLKTSATSLISSASNDSTITPTNTFSSSLSKSNPSSSPSNPPPPSPPPAPPTIPPKQFPGVETHFLPLSALTVKPQLTLAESLLRLVGLPADALPFRDKDPFFVYVDLTPTGLNEIFRRQHAREFEMTEQTRIKMIERDMKRFQD
ncbi:hypothetical protein BLNAU_962 [Blattamonas nauphoetae]|uniref:Uncharacterized protein n=1 Tax=Blattamonas nauphoetae TaxID=2049346 RepID=A0ABQ9YJF2_9EUKA|nr:hypothetical protein BLNAU_962 [Blattamonas nauphoetae]